MCRERGRLIEATWQLAVNCAQARLTAPTLCKWRRSHWPDEFFEDGVHYVAQFTDRGCRQHGDGHRSPGLRAGTWRRRRRTPCGRRSRCERAGAGVDKRLAERHDELEPTDDDDDHHDADDDCAYD